MFTSYLDAWTFLSSCDLLAFVKDTFAKVNRRLEWNMLDASSMTTQMSATMHVFCWVTRGLMNVPTRTAIKHSKLTQFFIAISDSCFQSLNKRKSLAVIWRASFNNYFLISWLNKTWRGINQSLISRRLRQANIQRWKISFIFVAACGYFDAVYELRINSFTELTENVCFFFIYCEF